MRKGGGLRRSMRVGSCGRFFGEETHGHWPRLNFCNNIGNTTKKNAVSAAL